MQNASAAWARKQEKARDRDIYRYFRLSVWIKGIISLAEIIAGFLALVLPLSLLTTAALFLTRSELAQEPGDFIATHVVNFAQGVSGMSAGFIAAYLISRGLIKLLLIVGLLRNKLWAYPGSLAVLGLFVLYQIYELLLNQSVLIAALTFFDLIVMYFIWREYQIVSAHHRSKAV